jgi:hypothetical protein
MFYRITLNKEAKIYKNYNSEEEAVNAIREEMEKEGFTFNGTTNWGRRTKNWTQSKSVKFVKIENNKVIQVSKSICWFNPEEKERIKKMREEASADFAERWDNARFTILKRA